MRISDWSSDVCSSDLSSAATQKPASMVFDNRKVLAWRLTNTIDAGFCVAALEEALASFGKPEIFNTDQARQFTSLAFPTEIGRAWCRERGCKSVEMSVVAVTLKKQSKVTYKEK